MKGVAVLLAIAIALTFVHAAPSLQELRAPPEQDISTVTGPITYFQTHCNRCHGDYGAFFTPGFAEQKSDDERVRVVEEMTRGPGNAPLEGRELSALVAFHRAVSRGEPFVAITRRDNDGVAGECSPGATVEVLENGKPARTTVHEHQWQSPAKRPSEIVVTMEAKKVRLTDGDFSHAK